jgi:hypothetical protein
MDCKRCVNFALKPEDQAKSGELEALKERNLSHLFMIYAENAG